MIVSYFINEYKFKIVSSATTKSKPINASSNAYNALSSKSKKEIEM